jgi:alkanesulfonate monooxygenase SsuD/methylene tetrahydromethanopterin reductase-like flavin-dependent oxidoreductase (luciferase family)
MTIGVVLPLQHRIDTIVQLAREAHEFAVCTAWFGQAFAYDSPSLAEHIVPAVTAAAEAAGRPAPRIVAFVPGLVTADTETVRAAATRSLAFYEQFPSYQRVIGLSGATRAADLAVIGDEETVAAEVRRYREAGATEVVFTATDLGSEEDRRRTWKLLGELALTP